MAATVNDMEAARAEVLRKLASEDAARKEQLQRAKLEASRDSDPRENIEAFLEAFKQSQQDIKQQIHDVASSRHQEDSEDTSRHLEHISPLITQLEQSLAAASYFLPSYEIRQCTSAINDLRTQLDSLRNPVVNKKFSFSKKLSKVKASQATSTTTQLPTPPTATTPQLQSSPSHLTPSGPRGCISSLPARTIIVTIAETQGHDQVIEDLENCIIFLLGTIPALRLRRLKHCQLYTGPVTGATFVDDLQNCIIMLASFQVRIHSTTCTDFYLTTRSKPIIEHCSALRFAPYQPHSSRPDLADTRLHFSEGGSSWSEVDDFGWIKATPSPNWSILQEEQRVVALPCP